MNIRIETWLGHEIRFVEVSPEEWWGVATDIASALEYHRVESMLRKVKSSQKGTHLMSTLGGEQEVSVVSEAGIYRVIMRSRKKEAEDFQDWVFDILETLRKADGLEGFQIFRMLDKEHQKEAMGRLNANLAKPVPQHFIKANTVANKTVSTMYGYPKMLKKDQMTPDMLVPRQEILDETVNLMALSEKFNLGLSISKTVQGRYLN